MKLKKFLYELCIFYMAINLFNCQLLFAYTKYCSFSNSEIEDVEVGWLGNSNRKIYTLFTQHLGNESDEVKEVIERTHFVPEMVIAFLSELLERHQTTIASEQSDAQKIIELAESEEIDWIGVERPNINTSYVNNTTDSYLIDKRTINTRWSHLPGWNANKTMQMLSLKYPAFIIARANHPETFHRIRIYPLEDENLMRETSGYVNSFSDLINSIIEDARVTPDQSSQVFSFIKEEKSNFRLISESEFETLLDNLRVQEDSRTNMRRLMRAYNNTISLSSQRDAAVVQSILELPGNGLVLFGTAHGPGIKQGLITACQNRNSSIFDN